LLEIIPIETIINKEIIKTLNILLSFTNVSKETNIPIKKVIKEVLIPDNIIEAVIIARLKYKKLGEYLFPKYLFESISK